MEKEKEQPCMNQEQLEGLEKDIRDGISMIVSVKHYYELDKSIKELQNTMDYLRVVVKYLKFDLEATHRENEMLVKMIQENNHGKEENDEETQA